MLRVKMIIRIACSRDNLDNIGIKEFDLWIRLGQGSLNDTQAYIVHDRVLLASYI